jgi:hypothetical protein
MTFPLDPQGPQGTDLTQAGDLMQTSLARVLAWIDSHYNDSGSEIPYEVHMAMLEGHDGIKNWTAARTKR